MLAGCGTTDTITEQPAFYTNLAKTGKPVDAEAAASMISDYRTARGLSPVTIDPVLSQVAQGQANAMARADTLSHEVGGRSFVQRMKASGYDAKQAVENVGAGYHTLAEAFSGWRDSPPHNKNMLTPGVTRMGIATANAPNSKYKVYWALVLAQPD
nr:CAP domain-containing protein [Xanthobacter agilis]